MNTNELIGALIADGPRRGMPVRPLLAAAVAVGFVIAAIFFLASLGLRPDLAAAATSWRFLAKLAVTGLLFAATAQLAYTLVMPGRDARRATLSLLAAPLLVLLAIAVELTVTPPSAWGARAVGSNSMVCLSIVPALSVPLLAAFIVALRHGAATAPWAAGAAAGAGAGAAAAFLYATHCADDSPLFVAIWYTLAIALVTAAGAVAGRLWLRW